ncbi:hypothetical protein BC628DRAFT_1358848 [Trametes gibbosa]|nr:hypothetical protein BC628DRAFT_1358848 [Trametes gibbosa]
MRAHGGRAAYRYGINDIKARLSGRTSTVSSAAVHHEDHHKALPPRRCLLCACSWSTHPASRRGST